MRYKVLNSLVHIVHKYYLGTFDIFFGTSYVSGQVSVWQSATLLPISCRSVQPVPARVEEPVGPESNLLAVVPRTIHPFQASTGKWAVKTGSFWQCAFRRRRRTRPATTYVNCIVHIQWTEAEITPPKTTYNIQ